MRHIFFALLLATTAYGYDACDLTIGTPTPLDAVTQKAHDIIENRCAKCHGLGKTGGAGVFDDILDVTELTRNKFIDLITPKNSRIFKAVDNNRMPKDDPASMPLQEKIDLLAWMTAGAKDWNEVVTPTPTNFIDAVQEESCILQSARKIDSLKRGDAGQYEWFTLTNVHNSGNKAKFENLGWALDLALNSTALDLSRNKAAVIPYYTERLDPNGIIRASFLPDIVKDARFFDVVLLPDYPFAIDFFVGNFYDRVQRQAIKDIEDELFRLTGRRRPFVRADFVVDQLLLKKYYEAVGIDDKRQKQDDIERAFGVNANRAIGDLEVDALVAHRSGVSLFNREIQRYDANYTIGGASIRGSFWKTFDVLNEIATRNFFSFPLGPRGVVFDFITDKFFDFDAGESIVQMPNGFQLYLVANVKGQLLREADTRVAYNGKRVHPAFSPNGTPGAIVTGGGCFECHSAGVNYVTEQLSGFANANPGITAAEYNAIKTLFKPQKVWDTRFAKHNAIYTTAHTAVVKNPQTRTSSAEPITLALSAFLDFLSLNDAAAEFYLSEAQFVDCLKHEPVISRNLTLDNAGQVSRDSLNDQFDEIVAACGLGKQIRFVVVKPPPPPPPKRDRCEYSFKNNSSYRVSFIVNFGRFGAESVLLFPSDDKAFEFSEIVDGTLEEVRYSERYKGSWQPDKKLTNGKIAGCRAFEIADGTGRPVFK